MTHEQEIELRTAWEKFDACCRRVRLIANRSCVDATDSEKAAIEAESREAWRELIRAWHGLCVALEKEDNDNADNH